MPEKYDVVYDTVGKNLLSRPLVFGINLLVMTMVIFYLLKPYLRIAKLNNSKMECRIVDISCAYMHITISQMIKCLLAMNELEDLRD